MSKREAEVLALLGAHLSNAEIAAHLHLSVRTVENHVSSLLRKCGVADRRELGKLAGQGSAEPDGIAALPAPLTTFIGRTAERERLLEALRAARLVTLVGPGGVGKTRLAAEAAGSAQGSFPSGGAFVDLVPVSEAYVAQAVAAALGVTERPDQHLHEAIAERLGDGRALLILDNCEHVIDTVARFAEQTLSRCPGTRILATSRERLGVPGERTLALLPFPRPRPRRPPCRSPLTLNCSSSTAPPRRIRASPPTPPRSGCCAPGSTGCRWPSNWPRPGWPLWGPMVSSPHWTTACACWRAAGAPTSGTARCARSSDGATSSWTGRSGRCSGGWPSSRAPSTWTPSWPSALAWPGAPRPTCSAA
ncbi:ATP-binding protein [Nonomuraea antimicrobica]